jgi:O-antigen ligase
MVFMRNSYFLCLLFLLMPIATIFKPSPDSVSLFTYLELLYVFWHNYRKKFRLSIGELLSLLFLAYLCIIALMVDTIPYTNTIKSIVNLLLLGYYAELDIEKESKKLFLYYIFGIILSSVICFIDSAVFPISHYVAQQSENFHQMMSTIRFSGLYGDPNYYSVNAIIAMCLTIILYRRKELKFSIAVFFSLALLLFIGMTGSKSSFLMLVLPLGMMLYSCVKNRNYWALLLCLLALFATVVLVNLGVIQIFDYVILRLTNTGTSTEAFTTGRSLLWAEYIQYLKHTPLHLIFGTGSAHFSLYGRPPHNTFLDLLFQYGIIGTLIFLVTILQMVKKMMRSIKRCLLNYSIVMVISVMYFFLSELLYIDLPFHLILLFWVYNLTIAEPQDKQRTYIIKNTKLL